MLFIGLRILKFFSYPFFMKQLTNTSLSIAVKYSSSNTYVIINNLIFFNSLHEVQ